MWLTMLVDHMLGLEITTQVVVSLRVFRGFSRRVGLDVEVHSPVLVILYCVAGACFLLMSLLCFTDREGGGKFACLVLVISLC